jgi:hypothetical protein
MTEPVAYTAEHLRGAIERPPVAELGVEVTIDGEGRIRVSGPVSCEEQRAAVVALVRREAPGAVVLDDLAVSTRPPDGTVERLA